MAVKPARLAFPQDPFTSRQAIAIYDAAIRAGCRALSYYTLLAVNLERRAMCNFYETWREKSYTVNDGQSRIDYERSSALPIADVKVHLPHAEFAIDDLQAAKRSWLRGDFSPRNRYITFYGGMMSLQAPSPDEIEDMKVKIDKILAK